MTILSLAPVYDATTYRYFSNEDKVAHFGMYAIMALLTVIATKNISVKPSYLWAFIFSSGYGCLMEILQEKLSTGRLFDWQDIVANIFGAFAGTMLIYMINRSNNKNA